MAESKLQQRLRSQGILPEFEGTIAGDTGINVIDADTQELPDGRRIRLPGGVDAPEVSHLDANTLEFSPTEVGGNEVTARVSDLIANEGYTNPVDELNYKGEPEIGHYGRNITNLANESGQGLSERLLHSGLADTNVYSSDNSQLVAVGGALERAQRRSEGLLNDDDILAMNLDTQARDVRRRDYGSEVGGKGIAVSERTFNPNIHAGVAERDRSRTLGNEIRGNQLDDAFTAGANSGWQGVYNAAGMIGEVTGWQSLEDAGYGHAQRLEREMKDAGYLRNQSIFDPETGEYTLDGFTDFMDWASVNLAQSLPVMGATLAAVFAAPFTGGISLAAPVAIYSGMNYEEQPEGKKDIQKAFGIGVLQAGLDVVGAKVGGVLIKKFFTHPEARKKVIKEVAKANNVSDEAAEGLLVKAMRGNYAKGMQLTQAQLKTMAKTNPEIAAGLGVTIGANGVIEGVTESAQEALSVVAAGGTPSWEDPKFRNRLLNAFAAGGVLGGGLSGAGGNALTDINLRSGLSDATVDVQNKQSYDIDKFNKDENGKADPLDLNAEEAFNWTQKNLPEKPIDTKLRGMSVAEMARQTLDNPKGSIDKLLFNARSVYAGQIEQNLRPLQGSGPFMDRMISPFLGNRSGGNIEHQRQLIIGKVADKKAFSERLATSTLGFNTKQEFSEYHLNEDRNPKVSELIRRASRSGKTISDIINSKDTKAENGTGLNLSPAYINFLDEVVNSNREANQMTFGDPAGGVDGAQVNILDRGFSPREIYANQEAFTDDLVQLRNIPRKEAEKIAAVMTNTETIVEPQDIYDEIAGNTSNADKYATALKDLKGDPRFSKYLENNVFNNIAQNGLKLSSSITNQKYFGKNGEKIAKGIQRSVANGEITEDQAIEAAQFFRDYQKQLSGTYNLVTSRGYNRFMNFGTTYASLNVLELAAISSFPEMATVLLHNNTDPKPLQTVFKYATEAGKEVATSLNELGTTLTNGHVSMKEYGNNRDKLREVGFMSEQTAPAARVGAEYSPTQARIMQFFFNAIQLNSSTNIARGIAMSQANDAVNSLVAEAAVHYPTGGDKPNKFYTRAIRELDSLGMNGHKLANLGYAVNVTKQGGDVLQAQLDSELDIATLNYMDQRIMTPRKGNRAKWLNDPRFRLLSTFQGYVSVVTTTLLPKIYSNLGGKDKLPQERINAIQTMVSMLALGALAIATKAAVRGSDDDEKEFEPDDYLRILSQSGLTGMADRPLQLLFPNANPRSTTGELIGKNVNRTAGDITNLFIGQSPIISNLDQGIGATAVSALDPKDHNSLRNATSGVPISDIFLRDRAFPYVPKEK